jgi:hypothetical protein
MGNAPKGRDWTEGLALDFAERALLQTAGTYHDCRGAADLDYYLTAVRAGFLERPLPPRLAAARHALREAMERALRSLERKLTGAPPEWVQALAETFHRGWDCNPKATLRCDLDLKSGDARYTLRQAQKPRARARAE